MQCVVIDTIKYIIYLPTDKGPFKEKQHLYNVCLFILVNYICLIA